MLNTINIKDFAHFIIYYFNHRGELITNKKLQKLLYYIQAWHLVYFEHPFFVDTPEAWVHGPVYPSIYNTFKKFKSKPITFDYGISREHLDQLYNSFKLTTEQSRFLEAVINNYGSKSALELEILTHREYPWLEAREGLSDFEISSRPIKLHTMHQYYKTLKERKERERISK